MVSKHFQWQQIPKAVSVTTVAGAQPKDRRASSGVVHGSVQQTELINQSLVKDIMLQMTTNDDVMKDIIEKDDDS